MSKSKEVRTTKQLAELGKAAKGVNLEMTKTARINQTDLIGGYSALGQILDNTLLTGEAFDKFCQKWLNVSKASGYYYQHINKNKAITLDFLKSNKNVVARSINEIEQLGVKLTRAIDNNTTLPSSKGMSTVKEFNSALQAVLAPRATDKVKKGTDSLKNISSPAKIDNLPQIIEQLLLGFSFMNDEDKSKAYALYAKMTINIAEQCDAIQGSTVTKVKRTKKAKVLVSAK